MSTHEATIFNIDFSITKNGEIMSIVYINEKENFVVFSNNKDNAYNNEFLFTREKGDKITYNCVNGRYSIVVPEAFKQMYSSGNATSKYMIRSYENFRQSLDKIRNGEKIELTNAETENFVKLLLDEKALFYDITLGYIAESKSEYFKLLNSEMSKSRASRKFDPEVIIKNMGDDAHREYSKFYKVSEEK